MEIVKIRTKKGRIITLSVISKTDTHISGYDKFRQDVIIPINCIDSMLPIVEDDD